MLKIKRILLVGLFITILSDSNFLYGADDNQEITFSEPQKIDCFFEELFALSNKGTFLAVSYYDGMNTYSCGDKGVFERVMECRGDDGWCDTTKIGFNPNESGQLAVLSFNSFRLLSPKLCRRYAKQEDFAFVVDGKQIAAIDQGGNIHIYDTENGEELQKFEMKKLDSRGWRRPPFNLVYKDDTLFIHMSDIHNEPVISRYWMKFSKKKKKFKGPEHISPEIIETSMIVHSMTQDKKGSTSTVFSYGALQANQTTHKGEKTAPFRLEYKYVPDEEKTDVWQFSDDAAKKIAVLNLMPELLLSADGGTLVGRNPDNGTELLVYFVNHGEK